MSKFFLKQRFLGDFSLKSILTHHFFAGEILTGDTEGNVMVWRSVKVIRVLKVQIGGGGGAPLGRKDVGKGSVWGKYTFG